MRRFSTLVPLIVCAMLVRPVNAAQSNAPPLHTGDLSPQFSGQTITGKSRILPTTGIDKPAVLVFSFRKKAAQDARLRNEYLSKDFPNVTPVYGVVELESAPKFFREMAVADIKSSMPISVQNRPIVLSRDEKPWKGRLTVSDHSRAYVLLLGSGGHIRWMNSGMFADAEYALEARRAEDVPVASVAAYARSIGPRKAPHPVATCQCHDPAPECHLIAGVYSPYFCTKNSVMEGAVAAAPGGFDSWRASIMVRSMLWC
ncbi:MAG: hypothetical protein ACREBW_00620 [Candidatus Micrarchaeaceae archaeon]